MRPHAIVHCRDEQYWSFSGQKTRSQQIASLSTRGARHAEELTTLRVAFRDPTLGVVVYENTNALPRTFRIGRVEPTGSAEAALTRLARRAVPDEPDHELVALRDLLERHVAPEDRSLLILRYLHGFDALELGEMPGRSAEAVRQRLARARAKLIAAATEED